MGNARGIPGDMMIVLPAPTNSYLSANYHRVTIYYWSVALYGKHKFTM